MVSRDEWDTKEGTGIVCTVAWQKATLGAEATSNSEKIKPIALAIFEPESISHSVSQSVSQSGTLYSEGSN